MNGPLHWLEDSVLARHTSLHLLDPLEQYLEAFGRTEMTEDITSSHPKVAASKSDKWFKTYGHLKFTWGTHLEHI